MTGSAAPRSSATVPTSRSERWVKQLTAHLGRKADVRQEADGAQVVLLAGGSCRLSGDAAALHSAVAAPDEAP